jgi:hypothetical protein
MFIGRIRIFDGYHSMHSRLSFFCVFFMISFINGCNGLIFSFACIFIGPPKKFLSGWIVRGMGCFGDGRQKGLQQTIGKNASNRQQVKSPPTD